MLNACGCDTVVGVKHVQSLWGLSAFESLEPAILNLSEREETSSENIGFVELEDRHFRSNSVPRIVPDLQRWVKSMDLDAAIWTDLLSNFEEIQNVPLSQHTAVAYLNSLSLVDKARAREYVQNAPHQIETGVRMAVRERLGWVTISEM